MRFGIRELAFFALLAGTLVASYFFVFAPGARQIEDARKEIAAKQAKLRQLEEATRAFTDVGTEVERLTAAIAGFEEKLPDEREVEVILKEVWELAVRYKLTPQRVQTDKPLPGGSYTEQPIPISIKGDFEGFYEFLLQIEKLPRITRMPRIHLSKDKQEGHVTADMVLSVFFDSGTDARKPG